MRNDSSNLAKQQAQHVEIDAEVFSVKLPRELNLRLMHAYIKAATPNTVFECSKLTLEGK